MNRAEGAGLLAEGNLFDFFRERVETAVIHQRAPVSENTVYYLSSLLAEQARREEDVDPAGGTTLVELQHRAVHAPLPEAVTLWRRLGDRSLLLTGFFREHLERRHISASYCERMGSTAYRSLERLLHDGGGGFAAIFDELSDRYHACAEVIAEVRDESRERNDTDLVKLYEEWLVTGSPRVAERLRQLGLVPARTQGTG
jgi:hypothetical protein